MGRIANMIKQIELAAAEKIVNAHPLPDGIARVTVEPGEDHYGDPVMWVLYHAADPDRQEKNRFPQLREFMNQVETELYAKLEDYRPQVGIR